VLSAGSVLNPASWPKDDDEKIFYGDKQVLQLAKTLHVDSRHAVSEFRIFKKSNCPGATLSTLLQRIELFPISSAVCERGFSCMNMNDTASRNRLKVESLSALTFLKVNGPRPTAFNPSPYADHWLKDGHHAASDAPTG